MRGGLLAAGAAIVLIGFILTITILGAIIGIPMLIIGLIVLIFGLFLSPFKQNQQIVIQQHVGDKTQHHKK